MDDNNLGFIIFYIENVAEFLIIGGDNVYALLSDKSDILDGYIIPNYGVLHTQGKEYIVRDIVEMMTEGGLY